VVLHAVSWLQRDTVTTQYGNPIHHRQATPHPGTVDGGMATALPQVPAARTHELPRRRATLFARCPVSGRHYSPEPSSLLTVGSPIGTPCPDFLRSDASCSPAPISSAQAPAAPISPAPACPLRNFLWQATRLHQFEVSTQPLHHMRHPASAARPCPSSPSTGGD
jgi:hypothetical protein